MMRTSPTPELFREFPELRERLPWTGLVRPTQVHPLTRLQSFLRSSGIWVKRDDQTSELYGGSRPRKLEFLFGDVLRSGRDRLLVFGRVGNSESLAITVFAQYFQLKPILALAGRSSSPTIQQTLQIEHEMGAELHRLDAGPRALWRLLQGTLRPRAIAGSGRLPYVAWPAKLRLFGTLGYVNAAYELRRQINTGILPAPEAIYVGVGTSAMIAGLALGLELAGIATRLIGVRSADFGNGSHKSAFNSATRLLAKRCDRFPRIRGLVDVDMRKPTKHAAREADPQQALGLLRDLEGLDLGTTAAHTMAALLDDARSGRVQGPILFWNTHAGDFFSTPPEGYAGALPSEFQDFFVAP